MGKNNRTLSKKNEKTFAIEQLQKHSLELFGLTRTAFAGATHGLSGEYTIEQMKSHIKKWLEKEAK